MMNAISAALDTVQAAAAAQTERMLNEINSVVDAINADKLMFSTAMQNVAKKRADADKLRADADRDQADAFRVYDTAMTNSAAVLLALKQQLIAGEIVTSSEAPANLRKLLKRA